jgi:hypothetical protein
LPEFTPFEKIPRLFRDITITEKIDGTNAAIGVIPIENPAFCEHKGGTIVWADDEGPHGRYGPYFVYAQSRKRLITTSEDNFGFAAWVSEHANELGGILGPGLHFGEWWGTGIQRGYGLDERRFSLFNVKRWRDPADRPACCHVVPVLYEGSCTTPAVHTCLNMLKRHGSAAAPGYDLPEGVVVYHGAGDALFKATLDDDHKGNTLRQGSEVGGTIRGPLPRRDGIGELRPLGIRDLIDTYVP